MNLSIYQKKLLNILIRDEKRTNQDLYSSGPYWTEKTKKIISQLKDKGMKNFRGLYSGVGTSYCDNVPIDFRNEYSIGREKLYSFITKIHPFKKIFNEQVNFTENLYYKKLQFEKEKYQNNNIVNNLISNYKINDTVDFGCVQKFHKNENEYSFHYLELLNLHDKLTKYIKFNKINSLFEIGGGFGANIHLLIQNYSNIKKILYLDIIPNLFVGTEYLRHFYGNSVIDYIETKKNQTIQFSNDNELEIICIAPWQIENVHVSIDHFHNSHSFVEMTKIIVENYSKHISRLLKKDSSISIVSYYKPDSSKILNPKNFDQLFKNKFIKFENSDVFGYKNNFYLVSPNF